MPSPKHFVRHEELIGLKFEGTAESAKEIVEWVKSIIGDQYKRGQMQRGKAQTPLGYRGVGDEYFVPEAILHISIKELPETYHVTVPTGAYLAYDPTELEVRFRVTTPLSLALFKMEEINADVS